MCSEPLDADYVLVIFSIADIVPHVRSLQLRIFEDWQLLAIHRDSEIRDGLRGLDDFADPDISLARNVNEDPVARLERVEGSRVPEPTAGRDEAEPLRVLPAALIVLVDAERDIEIAPVPWSLPLGGAALGRGRVREPGSGQVLDSVVLEVAEQDDVDRDS